VSFYRKLEVRTLKRISKVNSTRQGVESVVVVAVKIMGKRKSAALIESDDSKSSDSDSGSGSDLDTKVSVNYY